MAAFASAKNRIAREGHARLYSTTMASKFDVEGIQLIFESCLPLAVLKGFLVAEPFASTTSTAILMLTAVLFAPVLIRRHDPLLIISWILTTVTAHLPGILPKSIRWICPAA